MLSIPWRTGANMREFAYYGTHVLAQDHNNNLELQDKQLKALKDLNASLVRFYVAHRDFSVEQSVQHTKRALDKLHAQNMQAIVVLDDAVRDSRFYIPAHNPDTPEGRAEFPTWGHGHYDKSYFVKKLYTKHYMRHLETIVRTFADHPAVFCWELCNEYALHPQPFEQEGAVITSNDFEAVFNFTKTASEKIRALAPNHLISTGLVSITHILAQDVSHQRRIEQARRLYGLDSLDLISIHFYAEDGPEHEQERIAWDVEIVANHTKKPFYLGEVGASPGVWHGNRTDYHKRVFREWRDRGAFAALVWAFNDAHTDMGISDGVARMHGGFKGITTVMKDFGTSAAPFIVKRRLSPSGTNTLRGTGDSGETMPTQFILRMTDQCFCTDTNPTSAFTSSLLCGAALDIVPDSRIEKNGMVWWQIDGWIVERPEEIEAGSPEAFLHEVPVPVSEKIKFKVTDPTGLWVRRDPFIPLANRSSNIVGDLPADAEIEVYRDSRTLSPGGYVYWRHDDGNSLDDSGEKVSGWTAEAGPHGKPVFMELVDPAAAEPPVRFKVNQSGEGIYLYPGRGYPRIASSLVAGTEFVCQSASRRVHDGYVWWQVRAYIAERPVKIKAGMRGAFLYANETPLSLYRAVKPGQMLFSHPGQNGAAISSELSQEVAFAVHGDSQRLKDDRVWWKMSGWVIERAVDDKAGDPANPLIPIKPTPDATAKMRVMLDGGIWVRSEPMVSRPRQKNAVGDLNTGDEINVYVDSMTTTPDGFIWWRHDDGRKLSNPEERVIGGWSAERNINEDEALMVPVDPDDDVWGLHYRVMDENQPLYAWPDTSAAKLVTSLVKDSVFRVDEDSRLEQDGFVWWKIEAWVAEREKDFDADTADCFLHRVRTANEIANEKVHFRVINPKGVWVRREPHIPPSPMSNVVGELAAGDRVEAYKVSRTISPRGYVYWRHDNGKKRGNPQETVEGGWTAELGPDGKPVFMIEVPSGDGRGGLVDVEEMFQDAGETTININTLPLRDAMFDRIPVTAGQWFMLQHYGNTRESFTSCRYKTAFQGLHPGIDFGSVNTLSDDGTVLVTAGVTGTVDSILRDFYTPYGVRVRVGDYIVIYGHMAMDDIRVQPNQIITPDTVLGRIANKADIQRFNESLPPSRQGKRLFFWPHLHLEVRYDEQRLNRILHPLLFMPRHLRNQVINMKVASNHFFHDPDIWTGWGTVMEQPVIRRGGGLIGPLTRAQGGCR